MKRAAIAGVLAGVIALATGAHADPDLRVRHAPSPKHLKMRPRTAAKADATAAATAATAATAAHDPPRVTVPKPPVPDDEPIGGIGGLRDPNQPVTLQIDAGYAIDGTEASTSSKNLAGTTITPDADYARIRTYGFSDAYVGTHGVGYAPLQTFFSARAELTKPFQLQTYSGMNPGDAPVPLAPPIADWFTSSNLMIRSAWAEIHGVSQRPWLAPLRVRAGEIYVYGPWVVHMRGALAAWEGKVVTLSAYSGVRAPDYAIANDPLSFEQASISGVSARIDLRGLSEIPVAFIGQLMTFGAIDGSPATHHATVDVDWRPRRDVVVRSETRWLDNEIANQHFQVRSRYKLVTNLVFDLLLRSSADWIWDPSLTQHDDVGEARRYLDLGPIVPQFVLSARAGTVLFDNIDLLARGAGAGQFHTTDAPTAWAAPYVELAGAADVRLRRTVTLGASILSRENTEPASKLPPPVVDTMATIAEPLADLRRIGQLGFVEVGVSAKMSLGARRFSAMVEAYGRQTHYEESYCAPDATGLACALPTTSSALLVRDVRGGGRVTVDAWVNKHLRLFAAYDVSSQLSLAPEITGYKSLRLVAEGVY